MELVCSILRDDLDLSPGVSAILRRISACNYLDLLDRFLAGGHHGSATQTKAIHTYAIDFVVVAGDSLAVGTDLRLVFGLKYTRVRGTTQLLSPRQESGVIGCSAARVISQYARGQTK